MKNLMNFFSSAMGQTKSVTIPRDFKTECPKVQESRARAIHRMQEMGRKSILAGGEFSRNNRCLNRNNPIGMNN